MKFKLSFAPQFYIIAFISVFLFFAATNIQSGWLYIIDSLLVSVLFYSFLSPVLQVKKLNISRAFSKFINENDEIEITLQIENISKRIVSFIEIKDSYIKRFNEKNFIIKLKDNSGFLVEIYPKETSLFKYKFKPSLRGVYNLDEFLITSYGAFGLAKFSRLMKMHDKITVFPIIPNVNISFLSIVKGSGNRYFSKAQKFGEASIPYNIRDYVRGDNIRFIHWKSSAKNNKLMVKELENEQSLSIQILFDNYKFSVVGEGKESNFEYMIKFAGGILKSCIEKKFKVEFIYYKNNKLEKLTEITPMKEILLALAELNNDGDKKVRDMIQENIIDFKSIIIPCFPKPEKEDFNMLSELSSKNNYSIVPVFCDLKTFDGNFPAFKENTGFKNIILKRGETSWTFSI